MDFLGSLSLPYAIYIGENIPECASKKKQKQKNLQLEF